MEEVELQDTLSALLSAATPFVRIDGVRPSAWRRNIQSNPKNKRIGPWRYEAQYTVLDQATWDRRGEVIYFLRDGGGRLRLVGQSKNRLADRWRISPMMAVDAWTPLGRKSLFHTTGWPAIEAGFDRERAPFTVSALFREDLERLCRQLGGPLAQALAMPETDREKLSFHVETWVCSLSRGGLDLWNKQKV